MLKDEIRKVLEELWVDCNNTPTDGTIYDPIGVLIENALTAILELVKKEKEPNAYDNDGNPIKIDIH